MKELFTKERIALKVTVEAPSGATAVYSTEMSLGEAENMIDAIEGHLTNVPQLSRQPKAAAPAKAEIQAIVPEVGQSASSFPEAVTANNEPASISLGDEFATDAKSLRVGDTITVAGSNEVPDGVYQIGATDHTSLFPAQVRYHDKAFWIEATAIRKVK